MSATVDLKDGEARRIKLLMQLILDLSNILIEEDRQGIDIDSLKNEVAYAGRELCGIGGSELMTAVYEKLSDKTGMIARTWMRLENWRPPR